MVERPITGNPTGARARGRAVAMEKRGKRKMRGLLTWGNLIVVYLILITAFLITGCATHHSLTLGDTTYRAGVSIQKIERTQHD